MNRSAACIHINEFLRRHKHDLTIVPWIQITFGVLYSIIFMLGIVGNMFVVVSIGKFRHLRTVRNLLIFGLSASDLVAAFTSVLLTPIIALVKEWHFGLIMCKLIPLCQGMSLCLSILTLATIAVDRYILIVHPTRSPISQRQAGGLLVVNFLLAVSGALPVSVNQEIKSYAHLNICGEFCMENWTGPPMARLIYGLALSVFSYFVPLTVIAFCYWRISVALNHRAVGKLLSRNNNDRHSSHQSTTTTTAAPRLSNSIRRKETQKINRHERTNRMLMSMVFMFGVSWFPYISLNILRDLKLLPELMRANETFFQVASHVVAVTSTVWNPILYAYLNEQFRQAFLKLISACCCCRCGMAMLNLDWVAETGGGGGGGIGSGSHHRGGSHRAHHRGSMASEFIIENPSINNSKRRSRSSIKEQQQLTSRDQSSRSSFSTSIVIDGGFGGGGLMHHHIMQQTPSFDEGDGDGEPSFTTISMPLLLKNHAAAAAAAAVEPQRDSKGSLITSSSAITAVDDDINSSINQKRPQYRQQRVIIVNNCSFVDAAVDSEKKAITTNQQQQQQSAAVEIDGGDKVAVDEGEEDTQLADDVLIYANDSALLDSAAAPACNGDTFL